MKIPVRVKNCSIVDSICEIRFESSFPPEIVTGMMVSGLNSLDIGEIESLPVLQLPEAVRNTDEQLKFAPHYKTTIDEFTLQFSGRMIAISSSIPYIGWKAFKPKIEEILSKLIENNLIKKINRVARRTVNFFPIDILEETVFQVKTPIELNRERYHYTDFYTDNNLTIRTVIANQATYKTSSGSIIDIDSSEECDFNLDITKTMDAIEHSHKESKNVFFGLLKASFIESMEPEYDEYE